MNLDRRFKVMERKTGESEHGKDRSPRWTKNPYNNKIIQGPSYMVDYIDFNATTVQEKFDVTTLTNLYTGMKVRMGPKAPRRTKNTVVQDVSEDVVITFK